MNLEITSLYTVPLALMMFGLWLNVVKQRSNLNISIGDGGNTELLEKIRRHGNFIEFVPMVLLMMLIAELRGANVYALHASGILLVAARGLHPFGLHHNRSTHVLRIMGNSGSLLALFVAVGANIGTRL